MLSRQSDAFVQHFLHIAITTSTGNRTPVSGLSAFITDVPSTQPYCSVCSSSVMSRFGIWSSYNLSIKVKAMRCRHECLVMLVTYCQVSSTCIISFWLSKQTHIEISKCWQPIFLPWQSTEKGLVILKVLNFWNFTKKRSGYLWQLL